MEISIDLMVSDPTSNKVKKLSIIPADGSGSIGTTIKVKIGKTLYFVKEEEFKFFVCSLHGILENIRANQNQITQNTWSSILYRDKERYPK